MSDEHVTALVKFAAPYGREVKLENVDYQSGMRMLRVHIREGRRFTVMDLDEDTAMRWGAELRDWASKSPHLRIS